MVEALLVGVPMVEVGEAGPIIPIEVVEIPLLVLNQISSIIRGQLANCIINLGM